MLVDLAGRGPCLRKIIRGDNVSPAFTRWGWRLIAGSPEKVCLPSFLASTSRTAQRKSPGNRCELVAAPDPILTEAVYEDPPHRGHK